MAQWAGVLAVKKRGPKFKFTKFKQSRAWLYMPEIPELWYEIGTSWQLNGMLFGPTRALRFRFRARLSHKIESILKIEKETQVWPLHVCARKCTLTHTCVHIKLSLHVQRKIYEKSLFSFCPLALQVWHRKPNSAFNFLFIPGSLLASTFTDGSFPI